MLIGYDPIAILALPPQKIFWGELLHAKKKTSELTFEFLLNNKKSYPMHTYRPWGFSSGHDPSGIAILVLPQKSFFSEKNWS